MKAKDQSRFSIDALRGLAGDKVFARGETYHRDGQVQILTIEPKRVLAQVAGTEDYRTELTGRGSNIGGHCSCPAFGDWGVQFCQSHGRVDDALRRAEEGLWMFEDQQPDEQLVSFTVELLSKAGRKADAEALLWRAFEKAPSFELYKQLRKLGGKAALQRIIGILEMRSAGKKRAGWSTTADLLVSILIEENMFDAAWAITRKDEVSFGVRITLADASKARHPREALEVYAERVNQFVSTGGNHAYGEAAKIIARMAALQSEAKQVAYVATRKERHRQKRNFMKLPG
jgi:uncharacterized Zn finger protein